VTTSIAFGIILIYLTVKIIELISTSRGRKSVNIVNVGKFIDPGSSVDVILNNGKTYVDVKFIGFTKFDNSKDLPSIMDLVGFRDG
jgi:hypothetical protein